MRKNIREKIELMRRDIGMGLRNRLVFPKTVMGLLRDGQATKDQILRMQDEIDRAITWVDKTFIDFIEDLERGDVNG